MKDFRTIERELQHFFDIAGFDLSHLSGDVYLCAISISCSNPHIQCEARIDRDKQVDCQLCDINRSPVPETISLSNLARRLSEL